MLTAPWKGSRNQQFAGLVILLGQFIRQSPCTLTRTTHRCPSFSLSSMKIMSTLMESHWVKGVSILLHSRPEREAQRNWASSSSGDHDKFPNEGFMTEARDKQKTQRVRATRQEPQKIKQYIPTPVCIKLHSIQYTTPRLPQCPNAVHFFPLPSNLPHTPQIINIKYIHPLPDQHIPNMIPQP